MTITFTPLAHVSRGGSGRPALVISTRGYATAPGEGSGQGRARLLLRSAGHGSASGVVEQPHVPASGQAQLYVRTAGLGFTRRTGAGVDQLRLATRGYSSNAGGRLQLRLASYGRSAARPAAFAYLVHRRARISSFGGLWFQSTRESIALAQRPATLPTSVLRDIVVGGQGLRHQQQATVRAEDGVAFGEALALIYHVLVEEGVVFAPAVQANPAAIIKVIERLLVTNSARSYSEAVDTVVAGLVFGALTNILATAGAVDGIAFGAVIRDLHQGMEQIVEQVAAAAVATPAGLATAIVREDIAVGAGASTSGEFAQLVVQGIGFLTTLSLDSGEYIAWVLNTDTRGLSRYTNYPFNSFARIGGRYFAAAADGLHRLEGDSDNGAPIAARLRVGLSALGTRRLKRLPEAFVGYTATGDLLFSVIQVNEQTGEKEQATYRLVPRAAGAVRENRWKVGKGFKAVDFDFVIENAEGCDFALDAIEVRPMILDRRTRG